MPFVEDVYISARSRLHILAFLYFWFLEIIARTSSKLVSIYANTLPSRSMSKYTVLACVLASSIVLTAIRPIHSRECVGQKVQSITELGARVESNEHNGLVYDVNDLSHCIACRKIIPYARRLVDQSSNPTIKGYNVKINDQCTEIPYNLQMCHANNGVFYVKTTANLADYIAFYL